MKYLFSCLILLAFTSLLNAQNRANNILMWANNYLKYQNYSSKPTFETFDSKSEKVFSVMSNSHGELVLYVTESGTYTKRRQLYEKYYMNTYASVIAPYKGSDSLYYILNPSKDTMFVHLVDAEYNDGYGKILRIDTIPNFLKTDWWYWGQSEIIMHPENDNHWYIHNRMDSTICCTLLDENGLSKNTDSLKTDWWYWGFGQNNRTISVSKSGKKIALINNWHKYKLADRVEITIIDFDNINGKFLNQRKIYLDSNFKDAYDIWSLGVAFSADGSKLFSNVYYNVKLNPNNDDSTIVHYCVVEIDLENKTSYPIVKIYLRSNSNQKKNINFRDMILGPDKRIYISTQPMFFMPIINNPNERNKNIIIDSVTHRFYLSKPIEGFPHIYYGKFKFNPLPDSIIICEDKTIDLSIPDHPDLDLDSILWRGPLPPQKNSNRLYLNPTKVNMSGYYYVSIYFREFTIKDSVFIRIDPYPDFKIEAYPSTTANAGDTVILKVISNESGLKYAWFNGQNIDSTYVTKTGNYKVRITNKNGCYLDKSIDIKFLGDLNFEIAGDTVLCEGETIKLQIINPQDSLYEWSNGQIGTSIYIDKPGSYSAKIFRNGKYFYSNTIIVKKSDKPKFSIKAIPSTNLCPDSFIDLIIDRKSNIKYLKWSNSSSTDTIRVTSPGRYYLSAYNEYSCSNTDSIDINLVEAPNCQIEADQIHLCSNDTIKLKSRYQNNKYKYLWSTSDTSSSIFVTKPGIYKLTIINENLCSSSDSIVIQAGSYLTTSIQIIGNTTICDGETTILKALPFDAKNKYKWSNGANTPDITVDKDGVYSVEVIDEFGCKGMADTIIYKSIPYPDDNISISFDEVEIGNNSKKSLILTNTSDIDYRISNISINPPFALDNVSFPLMLMAKKDLSIPFIFTPTNIDESQSIGKISIDLPCSQELNLKANGFGYIFVDLIADTITSFIGNSNVPVGIKAKYDKDFPSVSGQTILKAKITYNNLLYGVNSSSNFDKFTNNLEQSYSDIEDNLRVQGKTNLELGRLFGNIYLNETKFTDVQLENISSSNKYIKLTSQDGKVSTYPICGEELRKIKIFKQTELNVNSVNTGDIKYSFYTEDRGEVELELRDINGSLINKMNYTNTDKLEISSVIPTNEIGSGIYLISLNTRWGKIVKKISLIK